MEYKRTPIILKNVIIQARYDFEGKAGDVAQAILDLPRTYPHATNFYFEESIDYDDRWYDLMGDRLETEEEFLKRCRREDATAKKLE